MNDSHPETIPTFAELAADPEIAPLLNFTPVPRKVDRHNGWKPEAQREFIALLAWFGIPSLAAKAIDKNLSGIALLYKLPHADSFRAAWDAARELGLRRNKADRPVMPLTDVPGVPSRTKLSSPASGSGQDEGLPASEDEDAMSEYRKLELLDSLAGKFMRKIAQEREAREGGEIVAADFYLRQITMLELLFELSCEHFGKDAREVLHQLRRGRHGVLEIAGTDFTDWLDQSRRLWWAKSGEPNRPPHPDARFLVWHKSKHGDYATNVDQAGVGALSTPARGYSAEEWERMSNDQQTAARERQFAEDAEAQRDWEAKARRGYEDRRASGTSA